MLFIVFFIILLVLFAAQITILDWFAIAGVTPDLALIFAFYCGVRFQGNTGTALSGLTGFAQDCLSGGLLGVNTLSKSLTGFIVSSIKDNLLVDHYFPLGIFIAAVSLLDGMVYYLTATLLFKGGVAHDFFFPLLPVYILYNAFAGPFLLMFLDWNRRWFVQKPAGRFLRLS